MPVTTAAANARYRWDWARWPVPELPSLDRILWPEAPWWQRIDDRSVDIERSANLVRWTHQVSAHPGATPVGGVTHGFPFQVVDGLPPTAVWQDRLPVRFSGLRLVPPTVPVPLPPVVFRQGDPGGDPRSDSHWIGIGGAALWEAISMRYAPVLPWRWSPTWVCSRMCQWDLHSRWDAAHQPGGAIAIRAPLLPLTARWDELDVGIGHCIGISVNQYSPEHVGWARGSDGLTPGHPLRGGDLLRLRPEVPERFPEGTAARVVAEALTKWGAVVSDRNTTHRERVATDPPGAFRCTMDRRWQTGDDQWGPLGRFQVALSDFEVLLPG